MKHIEYWNQSINESSDYKNFISALKRVVDSVKSANTLTKVRIMTVIVTGILSHVYIDQAKNLLDELNDSTLMRLFNNYTKNKDQESTFKPIKQLHASAKIEEYIKTKETLQLTGYTIGDNHIAIGYGHSEKIGKSKYKLGQKISKQEAERLFRKDFESTVKLLKQRLKNWEVLMTQDMFDALVSMAYNKGIGGLMKEQFMKSIKQGDFETAAEQIIEDGYANKKFPGLIKRRKEEAELFMSFKKNFLATP